MSRYKTTRTRSGAVIQAGLNPRTRGEQDPMQPKLGLYRAIVLQTYAPQLNDGSDNPDSFRGFQVECDVLLITSQIELRQVPVQQALHGVNNTKPWIPRPATRVLEGGGALNFNVVSSRGQFNAPATGFDNTDGEMVVVQFVEGMLDYPVITGALNHERSNRIVRQGSGWAEGTGITQRGNPEQREHYEHHHGAEVRINDAGDVLIDTVGAYSDETTEDASSASGQVRVRVKDTQRLTVAMGNDEDVLEVWKDGAQVRVDLGEGATERLVLGDAFKTYLDAEIQAKVNAFWSATYNTHTHALPMGTTGPPTPTQVGTIAAMPDSTLSDLARTKKT